MARISLDPPSNLIQRALSVLIRRRYGAPLQPIQVMGHHPAVLRAYVLLERSVGRWHKVDRRLKTLAVMASGARVGCSWCMDFGYWEGYELGLPPVLLRQVPTWRDSDAFSPLERRVLEYAEAMTVTPPQVTDDLVQALRADLGEAGLVELTTLVAVENQRSRFNSAFGLTSQGFADRCHLAAPELA